eukprot:s6363_g2.t1
MGAPVVLAARGIQQVHMPVVFKKAFENMIEQQLQEVRLTEFRQRLAARKRGKQEVSEGGEDDDQWIGKSYLKRPVPATELSIRSIREAGCMLRFLVCQTSLSVSASEVGN